MQWRVLPEESGQRLLLYLKSKLPPSYSTRILKRLLEGNACTLNGKIERFGSISVAAGDLICMHLEAAPPSSLSPPWRNGLAAPSIIYEDADFLFIDKPAALSSDDSTLIKACSDLPLILLHRLDKGTSGVLAFAKHPKGAEAFEALFRQRAINKKYLAIVSGVLRKKSGRIDKPVGKLASYQGQSLWGQVKSGGLPAVTEWSVEALGKDATLVTCFPLTGRTHQIRVHLSGMGFPIIGDVQYGQKTLLFPAKRPLLHAAELVFVHPINSKQIRVKAACPLDFKQAAEALGLRFKL